MKPIFLIVGSPGAGKSWVCRQAGDRFIHVPHDDFKKEIDYSAELAARASKEKALIGEIPFGLSQIQGFLQSRGFSVRPVFIYEQEPVLTKRYQDREGRPIPKGHITRQETYRQRAAELGSFCGNSDEVLKFIKAVKF